MRDERAADRPEPIAPRHPAALLRRIAAQALGAMAVSLGSFGMVAFAAAFTLAPRSDFFFCACVGTGAVLAGALLGVGAVGVGRASEDPRRQLAAGASRLGLDPLGESSFSGVFEGVSVEVGLVGGRRAEVRAWLRPAEPGPVRIAPRSQRSAQSNGQTGNPVLDLVASVERAPPGFLARLGDPANAEAALRVMHGYADWTIEGQGEVTILVRFSEAVDEYTLENTLRAVAALARVLEGPTPPEP